MNEEFSLATRDQNALETVDGAEMIVDLTSAVTSYCSMVPKTDEERATLYNATSNPSAKLSSMIGKTIVLENVYVEVCDMIDTRTGEATKAPRIIFFDKSGKSYACISKGVFGALKKLFSIFGTPDQWTKPLPIEVKQIEKGEKRILTFEIVQNPAK